MMRYLGLEFYKLKRRYVFLTALVLFLAEAAFSLYNVRSYVTRHGIPELPWEYLLMQLCLLNGLFCPVILAVISSRVCDTEHKGDTWKLLECCSERMSSLYRAKFFCSLLLIAGAQVIEYVVCIVFGMVLKFPQSFPLHMFFAVYFGSLMIDVGVLAVQQFLSMFFQNQFIALIAGLIGAFIGFAGSLFPNEIRRLFLWGYYVELSPVKMVEISKKVFGIAPVHVNMLLIVGVFAAGLLLYFIGRKRLIQKEM